MMKILFEDKDIIVCVKPAGMLSQSGKSMEPDMVSNLKNYRYDKGEDTYIAIVHRLDRPVSGIMVFAKNKKSASVLSQAIQKHEFSKYYMAVVEPVKNLEDVVINEEILLEDYIVSDGKNNLARIADKTDKDAKLASLKYTVLEKDIVSNTALVKVELLTGRHHQIRLQMSNAGYPLYGDTKYNVNKGKKWINIALCAYRLEINHPIKGTKLEFEITPDNFPKPYYNK